MVKDEARVPVAFVLAACGVRQASTAAAAALGRILDEEVKLDVLADYVQPQQIRDVIEVDLKARTEVREVYMNLQEGLMM